MTALFEHLVSQLEPLSRALLDSPLLQVGSNRELSHPGIYVFYERNQPAYVGITKNVRNRIGNHISGSGAKSAFAFRRAKEALGLGKATYKVEGSRKALIKEDRFREALLKHKNDVRLMEFRALKVDDPLVLYLLELYVALKLDLPVTEFQTH